MRKLTLITATATAMFLAFGFMPYSVRLTLVNNNHISKANAGPTDVVVGNRVVWRIRVPGDGLTVGQRYTLSQQRMNAAVGTFNPQKYDPVALSKPQIITGTIYQKSPDSANLKSGAKVTMIAVVLKYSPSVKTFPIEKHYDELELIYATSRVNPNGTYEKKALVIALAEITAADAAANHQPIEQLAKTWLRNLNCGLAENEHSIYKVLNSDHPRYMYTLCSH